MLIAALLASMIQGEAPRPLVTVRVESAADGSCHAYLRGVELEPMKIGELLKQEDAGARVRLDFAPTTSFRCIGGVIYALQSAGVARIGFISEPPAPPVTLSIGAGRCRVQADGQPVQLGRLPKLLERWADEGRRVHLRPHRHASYECVDKVLGMVRQFDDLLLGFVGNELLPAD
jgi:biopolymer transport protein ExbD